MTNAELLAKVKAEIERRKMESIGFRNNEKREDWASFFNGEATALENLLSFISTLEPEKPNDLEERWEELQTNFREINEAFEAGKKEQKEQMMKEAVEGEIFDDYDKDTCEHHLTILSTVPSGYKDGDKVKIIIVKED